MFTYLFVGIMEVTAMGTIGFAVLCDIGFICGAIGLWMGQR